MRPDEIHRAQGKLKKRKLMIQDVLLIAFVAGGFTWFSVRSLVSGELPMRAGVGRTEVIIIESGSDFWIPLSLFFLIALIGWAVFVWQGRRYLNQKKNDRS